MRFGMHILLALLPLSQAYAGHGMLNAFAGIDWLPAAGITPESPFYVAEAWRETIALKLAQTPEDALRLVLAQQRERLAELEAMIRANNNSAALTAINRYRELLHTMRELLTTLNDPIKLAATIRCATALLEQQYILSTDYLDLPRNSRTVASEFIKLAAQHYEELTHKVPARTKDSLVFKEEEVRWSWEMALEADRQGM